MTFGRRVALNAQHTVLGAFVGLSLVCFVLLLPLYTLAVDERREARPESPLCQPCPSHATDSLRRMVAAA